MERTWCPSNPTVSRSFFSFSFFFFSVWRFRFYVSPGCTLAEFLCCVVFLLDFQTVPAVRRMHSFLSTVLMHEGQFQNGRGLIDVLIDPSSSSVSATSWVEVGRREIPQGKNLPAATKGASLSSPFSVYYFYYL